MEKQYRVVVPFGEYKVGDMFGTGSSGTSVYLYTGQKGHWVPLEFISEKLEEVKPKALRKWLVEEVATREEVNGERRRYLNPESMTMHGEFSGNAVETSVWVKITEQKEEKRWVPKVGEKYWSTSYGISDAASYPDEFTWDGDYLDLRWLEAGDVFKTREECQAYIDSKKKAA